MYRPAEGPAARAPETLRKCSWAVEGGREREGMDGWIDGGLKKSACAAPPAVRRLKLDDFEIFFFLIL